MGAGVAVHAVILRYLDQVARVRSIRRAAERRPQSLGIDPPGAERLATVNDAHTFRLGFTKTIEELHAAAMSRSA